MKNLIVGLLAALCINALAMDGMTLLTPSPLGIVIAVNSYIKDQKKVYYIRVESQAQDFELAKKQAFRLASEQVVGTVVLSESELRNSHLTRNEIITYSSGLIDQYKIVDRLDGPNFVKLTVDVWIAESQMAQRLLAKSATERGIDGDALGTRVNSILEERQRGLTLIETILKDYPQRAFRVKMTTSGANMDISGNPFVMVKWEVSWDERFVNAFHEAAQHTGNKPCVWRCPEGPQFWLNGFWSLDSSKLNLVVTTVKNTEATVRVELLDIHGNVITQQCQRLAVLRQQWGSPYPNTAMVSEYPTQVNLGGKHLLTGQMQFVLGKNTQVISNLGEFRAEVVPRSRCL